MVNTESGKTEIKPLVRRLVFIRLPFIVVIFALAFMLTFMLGTGFRLIGQTLLTNLLLFGVLGAAIFALALYVPVFLRSTIVITDQEMVGHTGRGWQRCRISLEKIDLAKSQEQITEVFW